MSTRTLALLGGEPAVRRQVPFSWPPVSERAIADVSDLMRANELSYYGREGAVQALEEGFCDYLPMRYGLGTSSGTAALHSAYFGIGLEPGDEVLVPTYTFLATVMPVFIANAIPVLVDAEPDTGNLDAADIERHITPRTRALAVTHLWGHPCDMETIMDVARSHGLKVVEDCSHAHGAVCAGRKVGTFGDVSVFSLQAKKLVAAGQGGILVTNDREIYERANLLGHFKVRCFQEVHDPKYKPFAGTGFGLNYRIHPLAAALANVHLAALEGYIEGRNGNFNALSALLAETPGIEPPVVKGYADRHVYYSYKPLYRPQELRGLPVGLYMEALAAEGVAIEKSETPPLHHEPIFQRHDHGMRTYGEVGAFAQGRERPLYQPGDLPNSEIYAQRALVLPPYTEPVPDLMQQYGDAFAKVADNLDQLLQLAEQRYPHEMETTGA